jgi:hypothetical protein
MSFESMKPSLLFAALSLCGLAACNKTPAVAISPKMDVTTARWNGRLGTPAEMAGAVQVQGSASLTQGNSASETVVAVNLSNAAPGGRHPWTLSAGQCGAVGSELLRVTDKHILTVDKDGTASASATTGMAFPTAGDYAVQVLASVDNSSTVIACGNLAPPTTPPAR